MLFRDFAFLIRTIANSSFDFRGKNMEKDEVLRSLLFFCTDLVIEVIWSLKSLGH